MGQPMGQVLGQQPKPGCIWFHVVVRAGRECSECVREKMGLAAGMALKRRPAVGGAAAVQKVFLARGAAEAKGCRWTGTRPIQRTRVGHAECPVSVTGEEAGRSQISVFPEWRGLHKGAGQSQMCRSRRSSRSPRQTAGCWASSKARTPSSAELLTAKTTLLSSGPRWNHFAPILGIPTVVQSTGSATPSGGEVESYLAIGPELPEMQMRLVEAGRQLAEQSWGRGSAPGHFKRREGEGEGVSQAVGPGLAE
ncbi:isochorismatase domain-containing protein 2 isoform X1 [Panthera pardus]|uniref:Isochorismatase domain-containing protein 2 isoform X1 n=1 Tax=Panthera pardus TaxID=9691 RepID=A0A9V1F1G8_PANPR|nr:isochorismatase domain-containing protein 2 isoform X1 [Panthera pardus]